MADCFTHGSHGGAEYAVLARFLFGGRMVPTAIAYAYGVLEGAWPDIAGAIKARRKPDGPEIERWTVIFGLKVRMHVPTYLKYHEQYKGKWWSFMLGLATHVRLVDPPFHKKPAHVSQEDWDANVNNVHSWWPREAVRYIFWIIVGLVGIFFSFL